MPLLNELPAPPCKREGWPWNIETTHFPSNLNELTWPKISIVTPSFNQGRFIEETIRSVLLQNYPNLEFIVADGGSTDDTIDIIKKYQPWISSWSSGPDGGQVKALNNAFAKTTGSILGWLNSDDVLTPGALLIVAQLFMLSAEADIVSGARLQRSVTTKTEEVWMPWLKQWPMITLGFPLFPQEATFFSRRIWNSAGVLDSTLDYAFDGVFFSEAISKSKRILLTSTPLGIMHAYGGQKSLRKDRTMAENRIRLTQSVMSKVPLFLKPIIRLCYTRFSVQADAALRCILRSKADRKFSVGVYDWAEDRWALASIDNFI
jgi:glycosyltransferase involved in cell wall biosynthesis